MVVQTKDETRFAVLIKRINGWASDGTSLNTTCTLAQGGSQGLSYLGFGIRSSAVHLAEDTTSLEQLTVRNRRLS